MATFLDVTALENFSVIFVFIFVWLVVYAIFIYTKIFGENKAIGIIAGLIIGLLVLFSPTATLVIQRIAPWFATIFIFLIFFSITSRMFGVSDSVSLSSLRVISLVIIIVAMVVGSLIYAADKSGMGKNITEGDRDYSKGRTFLLHPKFLGMLFVLLIAMFTVALLAGKSF